MLSRTKIEYGDYGWNPIVGCTGDGCIVKDVCWARRIAKRFKCEKCREFVPHFHPERLEQPLKMKTPSRILTCFMSDFWGGMNTYLGGYGVWQATVTKVIRKCPQHKFLILTKQPQNIPILDLGLVDDESWNIPNLWQGVSVSTADDLWRIDELIKRVPARRVVSFEPLYGVREVDKEDKEIRAALTGIDWVIVGAQTQPRVSPNPGNVRTIRTICKEYGIPLFLKDNLYVKDGFWYEPKIQQYPAGW